VAPPVFKTGVARLLRAGWFDSIPSPPLSTTRIVARMTVVLLTKWPGEAHLRSFLLRGQRPQSLMPTKVYVVAPHAASEVISQ
jgi:hypothetical protein